MTDDLESFVTAACATVPYLAVGLFGCCLRNLRRWRGWRNFILTTLTTSFGCFILGTAFHDFGISQGWAFALCGAIGYSGGSLVDEFFSAARRRLAKAAGESESGHGIPEERHD